MDPEILGLSQLHIVEGDVTQDFVDELEAQKPLDTQLPTVAIDIETLRCRWDRPHHWERSPIGLVTLYSRQNNRAQLVRVHNLERGERPGRLVNLIRNDRIRKLVHHAMFDMVYLSYHYQVVPRELACTKIAARIAEVPVKESLEDLLEFFGIIDKGSMDKSKATADWFQDELPEDLVSYALQDVLYLEDLESAIFGYVERLREPHFEEGVREYIIREFWKTLPAAVTARMIGVPLEKIYIH